MTNFAFDLAAVRHWANFSHDFNPIHFDQAHALQSGMDQLVVHGMLALLPVKQAIAREHAAAQNPSRWMKFNAMFRSPIPHGSTNILTIHPGKRGGLSFKLLSEDGLEERFRGTWSSAVDPGEWLQSNGLSSEEFAPMHADDEQRFSASYPEVQEGWITLDAILFSAFMRERLDHVAMAVPPELREVVRTGRGAFMQTRHTVIVDTYALRTPGLLPWPCNELTSAMSKPEMVVAPQQVVGSVSLPVLHQGALVMIVEVGLLAKQTILTS